VAKAAGAENVARNEAKAAAEAEKLAASASAEWQRVKRSLQHNNGESSLEKKRHAKSASAKS
jgi:hypothetical protein